MARKETYNALLAKVERLEKLLMELTEDVPEGKPQYEDLETEVEKLEIYLNGNRTQLNALIKEREGHADEVERLKGEIDEPITTPVQRLDIEMVICADPRNETEACLMAEIKRLRRMLTRSGLMKALDELTAADAVCEAAGRPWRETREGRVELDIKLKAWRELENTPTERKLNVDQD